MWLFDLRQHKFLPHIFLIIYFLLLLLFILLLCVTSESDPSLYFLSLFALNAIAVICFENVIEISLVILHLWVDVHWALGAIVVLINQ